MYGKYLILLLAETLFLEWLKFECLHNKKTTTQIAERKFIIRIFFIQEFSLYSIKTFRTRFFFKKIIMSKGSIFSLSPRNKNTQTLYSTVKRNFVYPAMQVQLAVNIHPFCLWIQTQTLYNFCFEPWRWLGNTSLLIKQNSWFVGEESW